MGQLQAQQRAFTERAVGLVAISTDTPDDLAKARAKSGGEFPFVADTKGELMDLFQLRHSGGHPLKKTDIARPGSVLLDREGEVLWSSYGDNYRVRPSAEERLEAVKIHLKND